MLAPFCMFVASKPSSLAFAKPVFGASCIVAVAVVANESFPMTFVKGGDATVDLATLASRTVEAKFVEEFNSLIEIPLLHSINRLSAVGHCRHAAC